MHDHAEELHLLLREDLHAAGWQDQGFYPDITHRQVVMNSLASSFLKKFHNDVTDDVRDNKAIALFKECNTKCENFDTLLPRNLKEELVLNEMKSIIYDFFNPEFVKNRTLNGQEIAVSFREPLLLNLSDIATHFGLGSGSNIGTSSTDFYSKYVTSTMSYVNPVLPILFRQALSVDKLWTDIEAFRSSNFGYESVGSSRLSFVPKSQEISRVICTEPILNMLFQKGIAGVLEGRIKQVFGIDLSTQPSKNSSLARIGSLDGRFGTIDLSSASDTISLKLLGEIIPREPLNWLLRTRCPATTLPSGEVLELHMISSMGNGYTFPLQTMIFASLVSAVYKVCGVQCHRPSKTALGNFAVFGDDIIVDNRTYNTVVDCLELLGFSVNRGKSFNEGFFRESCGSDFWSGHNVRGVYLKTLNCTGDFYSAINRLIRWSANSGVFLHRVIKYLRRYCKFNYIPYDESDDAGIKVPFSLIDKPHYDITQAIKYVAWQNAARLIYLPSYDADIIVVQADLQKVRQVLPSFLYYPEGLLFCLLAGWIRNGSLAVRSLKPRVVRRRRVCPGWDNRVFASGESREYADRWKSICIASLVG